MKIDNNVMTYNSKPNFTAYNVKTKGWRLHNNPELNRIIKASVDSFPEIAKFFENREGELVFKLRKKSVLLGEVYDAPMTDYYLNVTCNEKTDKGLFKRKHIASVSEDADMNGYGFYNAVRYMASALNRKLGVKNE